MVFKRDEVHTLLGVAFGFPLLSGVGWWLIGPVIMIPSATLMFVALLGVALGGLRRLRGELAESLWQTQNLVYLDRMLQPEIPLPLLGGAALMPDAAALLVGLIRQQRPKLIVELGSGVSTLICAQTLKQLGGGRVISLDHDPHYGGITRENIRRHKLEDFAEVRDAPIELTSIDQEDWLWYQTSQLPLDQEVDLLIVDGPPKRVQDLARYPAARVMFDRLAPDCTILLDDTNRKDEQEIVRRWSNEMQDFAVTEHAVGKGTTLFRRGCEPVAAVSKEVGNL